MKRLRSYLLVGSLICIACLGCGCKPESLVSTEDEIELGSRAAAQVEKQYKVAQDAAVNQLVTTIGQAMAAQAQRPGIEYKFKVLENKEVNAFALPGGWIYINSGLVDAISDDRDMLAGVLGHEVAHVAARHHAEMMGRSTLFGIAIGAFTKGNAQQWASLFANLNLLRWSRKHELEADRLAIQYTFKSGHYSPDGVLRLLELLKKQGDESKFAPFLRTHPLTEDRIERAKYWIGEYRAGRGPA